MLEAGLQRDNAFITLTYRPTTDIEKDVWSLEPKHNRQFMDALRKRLKPLKIRFYMVGEYGEKNMRPHFHYALFGYPSCQKTRGKKKFRCCHACDLIEDVWGKGFITNDPLELGTAKYIARYVIKKMTRFDDPRLGNRHPEFARMSNRPGIGHGVLERVAALITRYNLLDAQGDVPVTLRHGSTEWPLGRYLRKKLRRHLGLDERSPTILTPAAAYEAFQQDTEMQAVREAARTDKENPSLKYHLLKHTETRRAQQQRRHALFNRNGKL